MCQTCYERGYSDYPQWVGSAVHPDSYREGWDDRKEEMDGDCRYADPTDFCQKCYDRGIYDASKDTWAAPDTHGGHYESYKKGYYHDELEKERILEEERKQNELERKEEEKRRKRDKKNLIMGYILSGDDMQDKVIRAIIALTVIGLIIGGIVYLVVIVVSFIVMVCFYILIGMIINSAIISLVLWLVNFRNRKGNLLLLSVLGSVYIMADFYFGGLTKYLSRIDQMVSDILLIVLGINVVAGITALVILIVQRNRSVVKFNEPKQAITPPKTTPKKSLSNKSDLPKINTPTPNPPKTDSPKVIHKTSQITTEGKSTPKEGGGPKRIVIVGGEIKHKS